MILIPDPAMDSQNQYEYLKQTYGKATADRYLACLQNTPTPKRNPRQKHWTANEIHRRKVFSEMQCCIIRSEYSAGYSMRYLSQRWGVSQGTIANVVGERRTYNPGRDRDRVHPWRSV